MKRQPETRHASLVLSSFPTTFVSTISASRPFCPLTSSAPSPVGDPLPLPPSRSLSTMVFAFLRKHIGIHPVSIIAAKKRIRINRGSGARDFIFARLSLSECRTVKTTSREVNIRNDRTINDAAQNPENNATYYYVFELRVFARVESENSVYSRHEDKAEDKSDSKTTVLEYITSVIIARHEFGYQQHRRGHNQL